MTISGAFSYKLHGLEEVTKIHRNITAIRLAGGALEVEAGGSKIGYPLDGITIRLVNEDLLVNKVLRELGDV